MWVFCLPWHDNMACATFLYFFKLMLAQKLQLLFYSLITALEEASNGRPMSVSLTSLWITYNFLSQKHGRFQFSCWKEEERWQCWSGLPWPQQGSQEAEQSSSFSQAASLRAAGSLCQCPRLAWWYTGGPQLGGLPNCWNMPGHHQVLPEAYVCPGPLHCAPSICKLYSSVSLFNSFWL